MFKKIFLLLLVTLLFKFFVQPVMAETTIAKVEYNLPYPGILPDSPLYIFKVIRDDITSFFIRDPKQNAFYQLFLSDKRLAAGQMLFFQGKTDLAATTILKSQEYFTKATDLAVKLKDLSLTEKLVVASAKHEDVVTDLQIKANGKYVDKLQKALSTDLKDKNRVLELLMAK